MPEENEEIPTTDYAIVRNGRVAVPCVSVADVSALSAFGSGLAVPLNGRAPSRGEAYNAETDTFGPYVAPSDNPDARAAATTAINQACHTYRRQFVTDICGQETVYEYKSRECDAWDTMVANNEDPEQSPELFPFIVGEASVRSISATQMRDLIYNTRLPWKEMARRSDKARQAAHVALAACTNDAEIAALMAQPINFNAP